MNKEINEKKGKIKKRVYKRKQGVNQIMMSKNKKML